MYEIYLHRNTINGKIYVGLSKHGMLKRWKQHIFKAKQRINSNSYFHSAIIKYGPNVWEHKVLETVNSLEEAEIAEMKWIQYYASNVKEKGYNLTSGGNVSTGTLNEEVRKRIGAKLSRMWACPKRRSIFSRTMKQYWSTHPNPFLGRKHSTKSKLKMSLALKGKFFGENNPYYGRKHSPEIREKMSELAKIRCSNPNWKAPLQYGVRDETRKKMSEARRGKPTGKYTKDQLLAACIGCKTQKQIAEKLKCTPANISFLIKHFQIAQELKNLLKQNHSQ